MTTDIPDWMMEGCMRGDRLSQQRFYEHYYGRMMGVCMRYSGSRDQAIEILNMGFHKVLSNMEHFVAREEGGMESWIYRIMVNTAIDHLRSEVRHRHDDLAPTLYADEDGEVIAAMGAAEIIALVNQLSPAYRAVFNLYVVEGYSHTEIAEKLGISDGTSKSNLAKARARLQQMIAAQNSSPMDIEYEQRQYIR